MFKPELLLLVLLWAQWLALLAPLPVRSLKRLVPLEGLSLDRLELLEALFVPLDGRSDRTDSPLLRVVPGSGEQDGFVSPPSGLLWMNSGSAIFPRSGPRILLYTHIRNTYKQAFYAHTRHAQWFLSSFCNKIFII